jgi:hypothetical protein
VHEPSGDIVFSLGPSEVLDVDGDAIVAHVTEHSSPAMPQ